MPKIEIRLSEAKSRRLRELAAEQSKSVDELILEAVARLLQRSGSPYSEERKRRALSAAGRFRSGDHAIARDHDHHLGRAYEDIDND